MQSTIEKACFCGQGCNFSDFEPPLLNSVKYAVNSTNFPTLLEPTNDELNNRVKCLLLHRQRSIIHRITHLLQSRLPTSVHTPNLSIEVDEDDERYFQSHELLNQNPLLYESPVDLLPPPPPWTSSRSRPQSNPLLHQPNESTASRSASSDWRRSAFSLDPFLLPGEEDDDDGNEDKEVQQSIRQSLRKTRSLEMRKSTSTSSSIRLPSLSFPVLDGIEELSPIDSSKTNETILCCNVSSHFEKEEEDPFLGDSLESIGKILAPSTSTLDQLSLNVQEYIDDNDIGLSDLLNSLVLQYSRARHSSILQALYRVNYELFIDLIFQRTFDVNIQDGYLTPLLLAVEENDTELVQLLLTFDCIELNIHKPSNGWTPLITAINNNYIEIIHILLAHPEININACDIITYTPLIYAIHTGRNGIIARLLAPVPAHMTHILINYADECGVTILMHAISEENLATVRLLLQFMIIDVNAQDIEGRTALMYACDENNHKIIRLLLEHELLDTDIQDIYGWTALMISARNNDVIGVDKLMNYNPYLLTATKNEDGATAFELTQNEDIKKRLF